MGGRGSGGGGGVCDRGKRRWVAGVGLGQEGMCGGAVVGLHEEGIFTPMEPCVSLILSDEC